MITTLLTRVCDNVYFSLSLYLCVCVCGGLREVAISPLLCSSAVSVSSHRLYPQDVVVLLLQLIISAVGAAACADVSCLHPSDLSLLPGITGKLIMPFTAPPHQLLASSHQLRTRMQTRFHSVPLLTTSLSHLYTPLHHRQRWHQSLLVSRAAYYLPLSAPHCFTHAHLT